MLMMESAVSALSSRYVVMRSARSAEGSPLMAAQMSKRLDTPGLVSGS